MPASGFYPAPTKAGEEVPVFEDASSAYSTTKTGPGQRFYSSAAKVKAPAWSTMSIIVTVVGVAMVAMALLDKWSALMPPGERGRNLHQHDSAEYVSDTMLVVGLLVPISLIGTIIGCAACSRVKLKSDAAIDVRTTLREVKALGVEALYALKAMPSKPRSVDVVGDENAHNIEFRTRVLRPHSSKLVGSNAHIAVICTHPWGMMGGNMKNSVPATLVELFARKGYTAAHFNFRGCGFSRGWGEVADLLAVASALRDLGGVTPITKVIVIGYSYGSIIASAAAADPLIDGFVAISTPFRMMSALTMGNGTALWQRSLNAKPKLFIMGGADTFTSESSFTACVSSFPEPRRAIMVKRGSHFWYTAEAGLFALIERWMRRTKF